LRARLTRSRTQGESGPTPSNRCTALQSGTKTCAGCAQTCAQSEPRSTSAKTSAKPCPDSSGGLSEHLRRTIAGRRIDGLVEHARFHNMFVHRLHALDARVLEDVTVNQRRNFFDWQEDKKM
jgi:hypothetical protein